ncbi:hypothetical protein M0802_010980 [Mischocyttarus mexicanus]|nr:hypothetical protein M0802_010980 [Mischocyttarus mexicanus]
MLFGAGAAYETADFTGLSLTMIIICMNEHAKLCECIRGTHTASRECSPDGGRREATSRFICVCSWIRAIFRRSRSTGEATAPASPATLSEQRCLTMGNNSS